MENKIIHKLGNLEITEKNEILVPGEIRFISDWEDYSLNLFQFPHILDKKIPGCGYTEYCIRCDIPIILCSPRKILLENKEEQHPDQVFYFKNELDEELDTDKDLTKTTKVGSLEDEIINNDGIENSIYNNLKNSLIEYINICIKNKLVPKILVTYDSFRLVKEILKEKNLFKLFHVVIDEFQSIFTDSRFKSTTEMEFIDQLKDVQKVCYVSATPMIDKYLKDLDLFKDLPYFELEWEYYNPLRIVKPDLKIRVISSIVSKAKEIIKDYKEGKFDSYVSKDEHGNIVTIESKEAVFYVNSVSNITSIIKGAELEPEECNILCARTSKNIRKLYKNLGSKYKVGRVPLRGEQHKMFTFCTRTVYLGADFYSTNARSFILSDANIDCLAVDISLDLPQILGRQRDLSNPWKNRAEFYYKTLGKDFELTKENFEKIVENKKRKTDNLLNSFDDTRSEAKHDLAENFQKVAKAFNYRDDYVAVNEHNGSVLIPVVNELVIIAERRAYDIQQIDYKDRFSVFNTISEGGLVSTDITNNINKFLFDFNELPTFRDKMKFICITDLTDQERGVILDQIPLMYKNYYETLGPDRCKALNYESTKLSREYSDLQFDKNTLINKINTIFEIRGRYTKVDIKEKLRSIYEDLGYNKSPKANDLEEYFEIRDCRITDKETGKKDHGFEIIKRKE